MEALLFAFVVFVASLFVLSVYRINRGKRGDLGMFSFRHADNAAEQQPRSRR